MHEGADHGPIESAFLQFMELGVPGFLSEQHEIELQRAFMLKPSCGSAQRNVREW